jgi:hypothetical protein
VVAQQSGLEGKWIHLRMTARDGHRFQFAISRDGREWTPVGDVVEGDYLPPWDRNVRVGLVAGGAKDAVGKFDFLRIEPIGDRF